MKKVMWGFVGVLLLVSTALAQVYYQGQGGTLQSAVSATGNGSTLDVTAGSVAVYQVSGTYTGTVTFEGTLDNSNWNALSCQSGISSTVVSSTTSTGFFFCPTNGVTLVRGRVTWTSGTSVTVNARASSAPAVSWITSLSGLTSPSITTGINDSNGVQILGFTASTTAVNQVALSDAPTGNNPTVTATGTDTNVGITLIAKGTGEIKIADVTTATGVHMVFRQSSAPTISNGGVLGALATDMAGTITAAPNGPVLTFASTWAQAPVCVVNNQTRASMPTASATTTQLIFTLIGQNPGYLTSDVLSYVCLGRTAGL